MNLTVGPLPPAVYWRRRAIVLGGLLLVVLLVVYACSGPSTSNVSSKSSPSATQGLNAPVGITSPFASTIPTVVVTPSIQVSVSPSLVPSAAPSPSVSTSGIATCTDAQIRVTPTISSTSASTSRLVHGGTYDLKLKVRNVSAVTCRRDVGGVPEQLEVMSGKTKIWSSDDCNKAQGKPHDIRTFGPDIEIYAQVKWDSWDISTHGCTKASSPLKDGTYSLVGRVGTKTATAKFTIVS
jgi:hypothetical protein